MKLDNLQILRGISALLVVFFHFKEYLNFNSDSYGNFLFSKGSIGVQLFFIISGFIMTFTTQGEKYNIPSFKVFKEFILKRMIRIIPLYYLLTFAWIIMGGGIALYLNNDNISRLLHSILFLPQKDQFPVLYLGWSLNYEMFFYVLFAISLLLGKYRFFGLITILLINITIGHFIEFDSPFMNLATNFLNIYFVVGLILGLFYQKLQYLKPYKTPILILSIGLFILFLTPILQWNSYTTLFVVSLLFLSFLLLDGQYNTKVSQALVKIGDISYSLYLVHPFIEVIFRRFNFHSWVNIPLFFALVLFSLIAAYILYEFVETKLTRFLNKKFIRK